MKNAVDDFPHYAHFLLTIFNSMFPPLLRKSVEFYRWFWTEHQKPAERLYSSGDLAAMVDSLKAPQTGSQIDYLVEWLEHQPIADACGVMDAIQRRIEQAQQEPHKLRELPGKPVAAVRMCLSELASHCDEKRRKRP